MGGMESGPSGIESEGTEKNFEYLHVQDQQRSLEDTRRSLGRVAVEGSGIHEPAEATPSPEAYESLGRTGVKNY